MPQTVYHQQPAPTTPQQERWQMPKPTLGQQVLFYHRGTVHQNNAEVAFVTRVGERVIAIAHRGSGADEVFHVDDPRLKANPHLRHEIAGTWEFTKGEQILQQRLLNLEQRLAKLEAKN